jgi:Ca2+-binding RTX toxin-like protein
VVSGFDARLFAAPPAIDPSGRLTFTPAAGTSGTTTVTAILKDSGGTSGGGSDTSAPQTFQITIVQPPPPVTPPAPPSIRVSRGVITITGSAGTDTFGLFLGTKNVLISGTMSGVRYQRTIPSRGITRLIARLGEGDDLLQIDGKLKIPVLLDGGGGDDVLMGCEHGGTAIILGGEGNDVIMGGHKADIIIGGAGEDILSGDEGSDLIVGGSTQYDANEQALFSLLKEWSSTRSLAQRVKNIRTGSGPVLRSLGLRLQAGQSVVDNEVDTIFGEGGADWFFADPGIDRLRDWSRNEPFDRQPTA